MLLDLPMLLTDGLLSEDEVDSARVEGCRPIDYGAVMASRRALLRCAFRRGWARDEAGVAAFRARCPWVEDYALYLAAKAISAENAGWTGRTRPSGTTRRRRWKPGGRNSPRM